MKMRGLGQRHWRGASTDFILGGLAVLGHAPLYIWPVSLICFALLMMRLEIKVQQTMSLTNSTIKDLIWPCFRTGFFFGFGYFVFGFYWLGSAFIARGPEFIPIMPFAVALFCAGLALFWAVSGALYGALAYGRTSPRTSQNADPVLSTGNLKANHFQIKPPRSAPYVFACILFLMEYARGHVFGGFPWNLPGYIFPAGKPISQIASVIGVYGLSALALLISASVAQVFWVFLSKKKISTQPSGAAEVAGPARVLPFVVSSLCLLGLYGFGVARLRAQPLLTQPVVDGVYLRIVHADIAQRDKFDPEQYIPIAQHYLNLSVSEGFDQVSHIIWPEGALPGLILGDQGLMHAIDTLMRSGPNKAPVFILQTLRAQPVVREGQSPGDFDRENRQDVEYYNAALAITFPEGKEMVKTRFYDKTKLVPFGEFLPAANILKKIGLNNLANDLGGMTPSHTRDVPSIPGLPPTALQICYEIIFPNFTDQQILPNNQAPELILNLSNDSWYGNSSGPRQHINQARYRAIEQGLPVVRSTSGGISGVIDSYGRQFSRKNVGEDGVLDTRLPRPLAKNIYNIRVDFILLLLIMCVLAITHRDCKRTNW